MTAIKPTHCLTIDDLTIGQSFELDYKITDEDLKAFATISGDWNPAHFNDEYAAGTRFKQRIAHGMISVAKFSGIFGMNFPGLGTIWGSQNVQFLAPVLINEPYKAVATVTAIEKRSATISTECFDAEGNKVLTGEAVVYPIPAKVKSKMGDDLDDLLA